VLKGAKPKRGIKMQKLLIMIGLTVDAVIMLVLKGVNVSLRLVPVNQTLWRIERGDKTIGYLRADGGIFLDMHCDADLKEHLLAVLMALGTIKPRYANAIIVEKIGTGEVGSSYIHHKHDKWTVDDIMQKMQSASDTGQHSAIPRQPMRPADAHPSFVPTQATTGA